ncbi:LysR family substrate-binding domain-containing protein [Variovorax sp. UC122_21]|uniref:LysR family substrate-binding domain-containing protein n=1 Tax=Variovorax sp. UC122_21 TaxID=3374554 RepID=UPI003757B163
MIAVPRSHPLAAQRSVKIEALAAESFISFPAAEGAGFVAALLGACQPAGFLPKVVQEAAQMQSILTLVAGGLGIALVPAAMRVLAMADVAFLEIAGSRPPPTYSLVFAHASGNDNPVVQSFLAVAKKAVEGAGR